MTHIKNISKLIVIAQSQQNMSGWEYLFIYINEL